MQWEQTSIIAGIVAITVGLVEVIRSLINKVIPSYHEREIIKNLDNLALIQQKTLEILVRLEARTNANAQSNPH